MRLGFQRQGHREPGSDGCHLIWACVVLGVRRINEPLEVTAEFSHILVVSLTYFLALSSVAGCCGAFWYQAPCFPLTSPWLST